MNSVAVDFGFITKPLIFTWIHQFNYKLLVDYVH